MLQHIYSVGMATSPPNTIIRTPHALTLWKQANQALNLDCWLRLVKTTSVGGCLIFHDSHVAFVLSSGLHDELVSLLQASPITIGGRQAFVEEKRATGSRGKFYSFFLPNYSIIIRNS